MVLHPTLLKIFMSLPRNESYKVCIDYPKKISDIIQSVNIWMLIGETEKVVGSVPP